MQMRHELPRRVYDGFGRAAIGLSVFVQPRDIDELKTSMERAANEGLRVAFRGNGRSYGDAPLNSGELILDMTRMNRVLSWDGETGVIEAEPGLTINQLWQHILADGWWPPVVPGTSWPTMGGCVAMNIHGKNHYKMGGFGDHVLELDLLTPTGQLLTLSREDNSELYTKMTAFNEEMTAAGVMLDGEGFTPTKDGYKLKYSSSGEPQVSKGPFDIDNEAHVCGFWKVKCKDAEEALSWAKKKMRPRCYPRLLKHPRRSRMQEGEAEH